MAGLSDAAWDTLEILTMDAEQAETAEQSLAELSQEQLQRFKVQTQGLNPGTIHSPPLIQDSHHQLVEEGRKCAKLKVGLKSPPVVLQSLLEFSNVLATQEKYALIHKKQGICGAALPGFPASCVISHSHGLSNVKELVDLADDCDLLSFNDLNQITCCSTRVCKGSSTADELATSPRKKTE